MRYRILFMIAWIFNIVLIAAGAKCIFSIFSMMCLGLFFIIDLLSDMKKSIEKGAKIE